MNKTINLAICLITIASLLFCLTACSLIVPKVKAQNLMEGIVANSVTGKPTDDHFINSTANFSIKLFKETIGTQENSLISPLSVLLALAMTANGAKSETLSQMQSLLGQDITMDELNEYLYTYVDSLYSGKKSRISIANSIWFRDDEENLTVKQDFLQRNADYYQAEIYKSSFDGQTVKDINNWVEAKTDGMIDNIVNRIDEDTIMYLINALIFDAEWQTVYKKNDIYQGEFTAVDGSKQPADYMHSDETIYLNDGMATGFVKPYFDGKYSFAALLPNEDISITDYIEGLSGAGLRDTLNNAVATAVSATLPKFSYDYSIVMNDALVALGMPDAFSPTDADFSRLCEYTQENLFICEVLHKTYISVDELGTKAGAVTKVTMNTSSAMESEVVNLNRPFVYAIIDSSTNLPIFLGTVMTLQD